MINKQIHVFVNQKKYLKDRLQSQNQEPAGGQGSHEI